ncbi:MAG: hypothetical protein QME94_07165, partial [Anaerolineae bacterium]|nr:hypothetical protein [Anaerolineae bacterium]
MTWAALLLADPSPCLRYLVLRELLDRPEDDPEVQELAALREEDPLVAGLLARQAPDGSWDGDSIPGLRPGQRLYATAGALARLGYLGFGPGHPAVQRAAGFIFALQEEDGSWPLPGYDEEEEEPQGYTMIPLQTARPLRGLALSGYATDARA